MTIEELRNSGNLMYRYLRGSWSHGIGVEGKSDYDYGGVYFAPKEQIIGLRSTYEEQISDEKNDETYYELGRWFELLLKSNPSALESLFIDKKFIIGNVHPSIQTVIDNRQIFLSKECFKPLLSYSFAQINKATGYNKKCRIPEDFQRKDILDFCYTFKNQGSQPIKDFLKEHNLDQRYCGLVNIPNMKDTYGVYYDFAAYFKFENIDSILDRYNCMVYFNNDVNASLYRVDARILEKKFFKYKGIVEPDEITKSNDVRLSSIPKGETPICFMTYNKDGYMSHCRDYKEWAEWKQKRNPVRYSDNKGYNFDAKNMCETVRLIHTGIELARDGIFNVERTWDREFLLSIKQHEVSYEEIMKYVESKKKEFDAIVLKSNLPDSVDVNLVNKMLIDIRKQLYF